MEKLNELIDFYEMTGDEPELLVMLLELRRHRQDNWKQRAEAVEAKLADEKQINSKLRDDRVGLSRECNGFEAKLAELDKQEPVGTARMVLVMDQEGLRYYQCFVDMRPGLVRADLHTGMELYTRPAPAVNLADLVPDETTLMDAPECLRAQSAGHWSDGHNECRAAILRNIEEKSK